MNLIVKILGVLLLAQLAAANYCTDQKLLCGSNHHIGCNNAGVSEVYRPFLDLNFNKYFIKAVGSKKMWNASTSANDCGIESSAFKCSQ